MNRSTPQRSSTPQPGRRRGFTLVELLVVVLIVTLVAAATIPAVLGSLSSSELSSAARILQAGLVGARDAALHDPQGQPHGIRLLPDPVLTQPGLSAANAGTTTLVYNRYVQIETAPDYAQGMVGLNNGTTAPAIPNSSCVAYPGYLDDGPSKPDPYPALTPRVDQEAFFVQQSAPSGPWSAVPYEQTNWYWNIKVGDQIRFNNSGRWWTIVGPIFVNPQDTTGQNPELFVNAGPPGSTAGLITKQYLDPTNPMTVLATAQLEYLFVVDGQDNDKDGYPDGGWDGFDNDGNGTADNWKEWAMLVGGTLVYREQGEALTATNIPTANQFAAGTAAPTAPNYQIRRRNPVVSQGARETMLPANVVIDATTGSPLLASPTFERSRLPIDHFSLYCDILLDPGGRVIPTTRYSSPTSFGMSSTFYHFWLTQREGVSEPMWPGTGNPNAPTSVFQLPMPKGTPGYYDASGSVATTGNFLKGERKLLTLNTRSGNILVNDLGSELNFSITNTAAPFWPAQQGVNDTK